MASHAFARSVRVNRTQRYPQYSDYELEPFFAEVAAGYCVKQAAQRALLVHKWVLNTMYSDDDTCSHVLDLSIAAGARIRAGELPVPGRWDRLYNSVVTEVVVADVKQEVCHCGS